MTKHLEYKGYIGSTEVDVEEGFLYGRLQFIRDVVSYHCADVASLQAAFAAAVDDYLKTCKELGEAPDVPCKGSFNIRVGAELHRQAALAAEREAISLNEWVRRACLSRIDHSRTRQAPQ